MADILIDGDFTAAQPVGAPRYEYPFRLNGDRVTAFFEQDYWQKKATFTPAEFRVEHPAEPLFYLVKETLPVEFMAGLYRFTRTFSRIPSQQTEWSSILVPLPVPGSGAGREAMFGIAAQNSPADTVNFWNGGFLTANWFYGLGAYWRPLKAANAVSFVPNVGNIFALTVQVPNHNFVPNTELILTIGNSNSGTPRAVWFSASVTGGYNGPAWLSLNANYILCQDFGNYVGQVTFAAQANRGSFGTGTRYLRCRRVTDYYLPGVSPGIATEADIPLPVDQSGSAEFIDALLAGTGDINVQVGELTRWRDTPIYQITKTVIDVVDLV